MLEQLRKECLDAGLQSRGRGHLRHCAAHSVAISDLALRVHGAQAFLAGRKPTETHCQVTLIVYDGSLNIGVSKLQHDAVGGCVGSSQSRERHHFLGRPASRPRSVLQTSTASGWPCSRHCHRHPPSCARPHRAPSNHTARPACLPVPRSHPTEQRGRPAPGTNEPAASAGRRAGV